jgi:aryl-alcohol dehydrogenase-like predicted oxidoreductase
MNRFTNKIAIGTVQFGVNYGISNKNGIPDDIELSNVLKTASKNQINTLDTASSYGNAESRIGHFKNSEFQIVSKFISNEKENLKKELIQSLNALNCSVLYGYLAHRCTDLIKNPQIIEWLMNFKHEKLVEKIGVSVYNTEELEELLQLGFVPDIIQLPYNLFDQRFETTIQKFATLGTEIHVRSVFLQGLFFLHPDELPKKLQVFGNNLLKIKEIAAFFNLSVASLALLFVLQNESISKVVVGVQCKSQLMEIIDAIEGKFLSQDCTNSIRNIIIEEPALLLPQNW